MLTRTNLFSLPVPAEPDDFWQIDAQGWCQQVQQLPSPNFGVRPAQTAISMLVIHNISLPVGKFGGNYVAELFQNTLKCDAHPSFASLKGLQVSSHFLIQRDGTVQQFVSVLDRAWHAGVSHFQGRDGCNDFSIGIELEGSDHCPFESLQYASLIKLSQTLISHFPIEHILGHEEIAPGRKTDPGPHFEWLRYQQALGGWTYLALV
jgi:AmpD protein